MLIYFVSKNKKKLLYIYRSIAPISHIIFLIFIYRTYWHLALRYYVYEIILFVIFKYSTYFKLYSISSLQMHIDLAPNMANLLFAPITMPCILL